MTDMTEVFPIFEHLQTLGRLGEGGCGTVWLARNLSTNELVAAKVPRAGFRSSDALARFEDECDLLLRLPRHDNVVKVMRCSVATEGHSTAVRSKTLLALDDAATSHAATARLDSAPAAAIDPLGAAGDAPMARPRNDLFSETPAERRTAEAAGAARVPALEMEYIENARTILEYAERRQLDQRSRVALLAEACRGVAHLHLHGVVHLDLKPSNILVDDVAGRPGRPRVMDLGAAKVRLHRDRRDPLFSIRYASPEQLTTRSPETLTQASDVYSLGKLLAALVAGQAAIALPNTGSREEQIKAALDWRAERVRNFVPDIDPDLYHIIARATDPNPRERAHAYESASDLGRGLREWLVPRRTKLFDLAYRGANAVPLPVWRLAAVVCAALLATGLAMAAGYGSVRAGGAAAMYLPVMPPATFDHVVVLQIRPEDTAEQIGAAAMALGAPEVDAKDPPSLRWLYAKLIPLLVDGGAKAIVFDVSFPENPAYREATRAMCEAIIAATKGGCPVAVGNKDMWSSRPGPDQIDSELAGVVESGHLYMNPEGTPTYAGMIYVARLSPERGLVRSLPTAGVEAWLGGRREVDLEIDEEASVLRFHSRGQLEVPLSRVGPQSMVHDADAPSDGTPDAWDAAPLTTPAPPGSHADLVGILRFALPPPETLLRATLPLLELLAMPPHERQNRLDGRLIVISNNFDSGDLLRAEHFPGHSGGPGAWVHAAVIEAMLEGNPPRDTSWNLFARMLAAAFLGCGAVWIGLEIGLLKPRRRAPASGGTAPRRGLAAIIAWAVVAAILLTIWLAAKILHIHPSFVPTQIVLAALFGAALGVTGSWLGPCIAIEWERLRRSNFREVASA